MTWSISARRIRSGSWKARDENDRHEGILINAYGGLDAVHVGHLDVGDDQVRLFLPAALHQLGPRAGHDDHLVPQPGQHLA